MNDNKVLKSYLQLKYNVKIKKISLWRNWYVILEKHGCFGESWYELASYKVFIDMTEIADFLQTKYDLKVKGND